MANASIYSLIQPPKIASPMETMGGALQIKNLMDEQQMNALKFQEAERGIAADQKIRDLFSGGGTVAPEQVMGIDPQKGLAYGKTLAEREKAAAELRKTKMESLVKSANLLKERL